MPSVEANLITYLKTKPAVTGLVGTGDDARIYLEFAKQGVALPYIVIELISGQSFETLSSISGIARSRVQIDCYGSTKSEAYNLAEAVRLAPLQMYRGTFGDGWTSGITSPETYDTGSTSPSAGANDQKFWYSRDYFITYQEPVS
jgi:hypothetical protein